jgi:hypothetical protein
MTPKQHGTNELCTDEPEWRHVWLANAMIDSRKLIAAEITRYKIRTRQPSLTLRLHKLRRLRAALAVWPDPRE